MRTHYLQHVPFEGLGSIAPRLQLWGDTITGSRLFAGERLPVVTEFDFLIIVGGSMSVNDEEKFPWLVQEKHLIREAIEAGKSVLGICLGAQLIASALHARVFRQAKKEIGWFPIQGTSHDEAIAASTGLFHFPATETVFHWHGETFELPTGAQRLASSRACANQAFQLGQRVIGLQFHLEATASTVQEIIANCGEELVAAEYVQTATTILAASQDRYQKINSLMDAILEFLRRPSDVVWDAAIPSRQE